MLSKDKQRVMVTLTSNQVSRLDEIAEETGVSRSGLVSLAVSQWLRAWDGRADGCTLSVFGENRGV